MISAAEFDKLSQLGSLIRECPDPFGGLQVVLCGDFFQLPPVSPPHRSAEYCFTSATWTRMFNPSNRYSNIIILDEIVRQKDGAFCEILNEIRWGRVRDSTDHILTHKSSGGRDSMRARWVASSENYQITTDAIGGLLNDLEGGVGNKIFRSEPLELPWASSKVRLYSRNRDVDALNTSRLSDLPGEVVAYHAHDSSPSFAVRLDSDTRAQRVLRLKVGAEVMLLQNLDCRAGLVNGSIGKVVGFVEESSQSNQDSDSTVFRGPCQGVALPIVRFRVERSAAQDNDYLERTLRQQGMERFVTSSNKGYKILCRMGYEPWKGLGVRENGRVEPVPCMDVEKSACTYLERTVEFAQFTLEDAYQEVIATRHQIPLKLAYAVTIHKVSGLMMHCTNI